MPDIKRPTGWDRLQGLFFGVAFCGFIWALFSYLLPIVMGATGQSWAAPGTGALGGLALLALGVVGLAVVAIIRPKRGDPKQE
jgi:F0F1-type ATP synthase membrane subunit a